MDITVKVIGRRPGSARASHEQQAGVAGESVLVIVHPEEVSGGSRQPRPLQSVSSFFSSL